MKNLKPRAFNFLSRAPLWLTQRPASTYIIVYLSAIPFFMVAYLLCSNGLYAPYARLEKSWRQASGKLDYALTRDIRSALDKKIAEAKTVIPSMSVVVQGSDTSDGKSVDATIAIVSKTETSSPFLITKGKIVNAVVSDGPWLWLQKNSGEREAEDSSSQIALTLGLSASDGHKESDDIKNNISYALGINLSDPNSRVILDVRRSTVAALNGFLRAYDGDISGINGNPFRMLYLSVVVLTTLGLGDIVPISGLARFFVGLEAISGIIIMGLFINSIANSSQTSKM